jgi:Ni2+-binding GTPase involved in maturation of urease and hydrogenase
MSEQNAPLLAFVGGFLGAGKTTLILRAIETLDKRGKRSAFIANDQDGGLVDTQHARALGVLSREVAGGCFCCRFSDLMDASDALRAHQPDVIFAEPVGSCVDLSATILQPLKAYHRETYRLAPLSVLVGPLTAGKVSEGSLESDIEFLFNNQLAEADLVCLTKQDEVSTPAPVLSFPVDFRLSARTGEGVERWLEEVLNTKRVVGARLLEVDYKRYAEAEAALGWINLHAQICLSEPASPSLLCGPLFDSLADALSARRVTIAHLKLFDQCASGWIKVSLSVNGMDPVPEGDLLAEPVREHEIALNLRAVEDPNLLRRLVEDSLHSVPGSVRISHLSAFKPAAPRPEHRFSTAYQ